MNLLKRILISSLFALASALSAQTGIADLVLARTAKYTGAATPAQIVANTNDYAPAGMSTAYFLRLSTDASRNITGLTGGVAGRLIWIINVGSFNIVLVNESALSTAANRFTLEGNHTLSTGDAMCLWYDAVTSRWQALDAPGLAGGITALTGDVTASGPGSAATTLATVNGSPGTFGSATTSLTATVNGKGLITALSSQTVTPAVGSITGLGTGVATALATNVGTAGAPVVNGGALGTPSSGSAANLTTTTQAQGDNSTKLASTAYVDASIADFNIKDPVNCATVTALPFSPSYSNGSSGVGATLTGSLGILVIDGYTPLLNDRILVKNEASTLTQGVYTVTRLGTIGIGYILTRTTDFNQTANILYGDSVGVLAGTVNANQQFTMNNQTAITVGSTAITFAQTSGGSQLTQGTGITITGNTVAITVPVTIANGGTGATSLTNHGVVTAGASALTTVAPSTSGNVLTSNGTDWTSAAAAGTTYALKLTYTGTPQTALVLPLEPGIAVVPVAAVGGQATYTAGAGPVISVFNYGETNASAGNRILTLSFDDLTGVSGNFTPNNMAALTSLQANTLVSVGGTFVPITMPLLTTLQANALVNVGGEFAPQGMAALTTLQFNALVNVGAIFDPQVMATLTTFQFNALANVAGTFNPKSMAALTTLQVNALVNVGLSFTPSTMAALTTLQANALVNVGGAFNPNTMASLVTLQFDAVQTIGSTFSPSSMAACTTVSMAGMVTYGSTIAIPSATMANVASFTMGTIGTLKAITGATITLSGLKLPSANVNAILALLVSLDGTGGTTTWGSGKTLTINGGTNGAPTGQGATDKTTLQGRGATVTTN